MAKSRRRKLKKTSYQNGGNIFTQQGFDASAFGQTGFGKGLSSATAAAPLGTLGAGAVDMLDPKNKYGTRSNGGAFASGALSGAAMGAAAGPPGMAIGAVIGGVTSLFGNTKAKRAERKAKKKEQQLAQAAMYSDSDAIFANYNNQGTGITEFEHGGIMPYPYQNQMRQRNNLTPHPSLLLKKGGKVYYQLGGEVMPESMPNMPVEGGQLQPLSSSAMEVKGSDPNMTDNVGIGDQTYVDHNEVIRNKEEGLDIFSDTLKPPGSKKTFAVLAKALEKQKKEGDPMFDLSNERVDMKLDELFEMQQIMNGDSKGESTDVPPIEGETPGMGYNPAANPGAGMFQLGGEMKFTQPKMNETLAFNSDANNSKAYMDTRYGNLRPYEEIPSEFIENPDSENLIPLIQPDGEPMFLDRRKAAPITGDQALGFDTGLSQKNAHGIPYTTPDGQQHWYPIEMAESAMQQPVPEPPMVDPLVPELIPPSTEVPTTRTQLPPMRKVKEAPRYDSSKRKVTGRRQGRWTKNQMGGRIENSQKGFQMGGEVTGPPPANLADQYGVFYPNIPKAIDDPEFLKKWRKVLKDNKIVDKVNAANDASKYSTDSTPESRAKGSKDFNDLRQKESELYDSLKRAMGYNYDIPKDRTYLHGGMSDHIGNQAAHPFGKVGFQVGGKIENPQQGTVKDSPGERYNPLDFSHLFEPYGHQNSWDIYRENRNDARFRPPALMPMYNNYGTYSGQNVPASAEEDQRSIRQRDAYLRRAAGVADQATEFNRREAEAARLASMYGSPRANPYGYDQNMTNSSMLAPGYNPEENSKTAGVPVPSAAELAALKEAEAEKERRYSLDSARAVRNGEPIPERNGLSYNPETEDYKLMQSILQGNYGNDQPQETPATTAAKPAVNKRVASPARATTPVRLNPNAGAGTGFDMRSTFGHTILPENNLTGVANPYVDQSSDPDNPLLQQARAEESERYMDYYNNEPATGTGTETTPENNNRKPFKLPQGLEDLAMYGENLSNQAIINSTPLPPKYRLQKPVKLDKMTAADQINENKRQARAAMLAANMGNVSAQNRGGNTAAILAAQLNAQNQIYGRRDNINASIANRNQMMNSQIGTLNNRLVNQHGQDLVARKNAMNRLSSQNLTDLFSKMRGLRGERHKMDMDQLAFEMLLNSDTSNATRRGLAQSWMDRGLYQNLNAGNNNGTVHNPSRYAGG